MIQEAFDHHFYEMMREEHRQLTQTIEELRAQLAEPDPAVDALTATVGRLADLARGHFDHEEQGGYMADAIDEQPRLAERAAELEAEHASMRKDLDALLVVAKKCGQGQERVQTLRDSLQRFLTKLLDHEAAENDIVQEAFIEDIGSKD